MSERDAPADSSVTNPSDGWLRRRLNRLLVVVAGILFLQFTLYGTSLSGKTILLPLDILAVSGIYLPQTPEVQKIIPRNLNLSDLVCQFEPERRFAVSEIRAGRFPAWAPYQYAGAPVSWPRFSLFQVPGFFIASPIILPWLQLLAALVAGLGAYAFFRRVLHVSFWAAAIPAWCYPLTGFFIYWLGFPTAAAAYWLPWLLLSVDLTMRQTNRWAPAGLGLVTALVLTSGHVDVAGQVLLASGLFALRCWWSVHPQAWFGRVARGAIIKLVIGWTAGFLLAAPYIIPLVQYAQTGARMMHRAAGAEERPPIGIHALPQVLFPQAFGSTEVDSLELAPFYTGVLQESSATAYAGVAAILLAAPLAWCGRQHRRDAWFWLFFGFLGLSWCLNIPGLVWALRLPGLNMMSHNRLTFCTAFAILALAAIGFEALLRGDASWRKWFWIPATVLVVLTCWAGYRTSSLSGRIVQLRERLLEQGRTDKWIRNPADVQHIQVQFVRTNLTAAIVCGLAAGGWLCLRLKNLQPGKCVVLFGGLMLGELLFFANGRAPQCAPALYYPRLPALEAIARMPPGRVVGNGCLPPQLAFTHGLLDVRGYDSIDPARFIDLIESVNTITEITTYARTLNFATRVKFTGPDSIEVSPLLDMLNVRYVIFRGPLPAGLRPLIHSHDYYVFENRAALPRVYVPRRVEILTNETERLEKLRSGDFDPRAVACVEEQVNLPADCRGSAAITTEIPTRINISIKMETPGLVVLADLWDRGWHAYLDGKSVPILWANHALRGVVAPAGDKTLEFRYEPANFIYSLWLATLGLLVILGYALFGVKLPANNPP